MPDEIQDATDLEALKAIALKWRGFSRKHEDDKKLLDKEVEALKSSTVTKTETTTDNKLVEEVAALKELIVEQKKEAEAKIADAQKSAAVTAFISKNKLPEQAEKVLSRYTIEEINEQEDDLVSLFAPVAPAKAKTPNILQGVKQDTETTTTNTGSLQDQMAAWLESQENQD
jgi:hypothetical protein